MNKYRTGKRPARPGAIRHKFSSLFDASALPVPPPVFGRTSYFPEDGWGILGNDEAGCCVLSGGDHETMLLNALGGKGAPTFTKANTWADYSAITGFDPAQFDAKGGNPTDQGTDMVEAAKYRQSIGLIDAAGVRHKIDGFVSLHAGDVEQVTLAAYLFGAVGVGVNLTRQCEDQFDANEPWAMTSKPGNEGGHYVPVVGSMTSSKRCETVSTTSKRRSSTAKSEIWCSRYRTRRVSSLPSSTRCLSMRRY